MKSSSLYLRVGLLVVAGVALAAGFLVFLAGGRGSGPATVFETYSRESVQGLDVGATVRYRGVPVGRVTEIGLASAEYRRPEGAPFTEAFQLVLVRFAVDEQRVGEVPSVDEAIRLGLRARITAQGITGVNYVELDFVNPDRFPPMLVPWQARYPVLPSIPSTVEQVRTAAETLVTRLSDLPLETIITNLVGVLENLNRETSASGNIAATLSETARTVAAIRAAVEGGNLQASLEEVRAAAAAARALIAGPEVSGTVASVSAAAADIRRTTARLPGTMENLERTLRSTRGVTAEVQSELAPILADLRATAANLRAATEQLRASPSQLIFGAPPAPDRRR